MDNVTITVLSTLIAIAVGAFVTWLVARVYYEKASKDLSKGAETLRQLNVLMLRAMEDAGLAKFTRDAAGNPISLLFDRTVLDISALSDVQFEGAVKKAKPDPKDAGESPEEKSE